MSTTPRPPLLSDAGITEEVPYEANFYDCELTGKRVRDIYEASRAKDAELIQRLVDEVAAWMQPDLDERFRGEQWHQSKRILDAAAVAGFKPSDR